MLRTVWPDMSDERSVSLFHKGVKGQWAADTFDWTKDVGMDKFERTSLARILTPVYVGEETALAGASAVMLKLFGTPRTRGSACSSRPSPWTRRATSRS